MNLEVRMMSPARHTPIKPQAMMTTAAFPAAANQLLHVCFLSLRLLSARYVHDNNAAFELPEANSFKSVEDFVEAQRRAFVSGFRIST